MIDFYDFGKIIIDGISYMQDIIIYPEKIQCPWRRRVSHFLEKDELIEFLTFEPKLVIMGTGYGRAMQIDVGAEKYLKDSGIGYIIESSQNACARYNQLSDTDKKETIFFIHLTC